MRGRDGERIFRGEDSVLREVPIGDTPFGRGEAVTPLPLPEMSVGTFWPGRVMRALLGIREVCLIVALVLASVLMVLLVAGFGTIMNAISQAA